MFVYKSEAFLRFSPKKLWGAGCLAASCAVASIGSLRPRLSAAFLLLVGLLVSSGRLQADDLVVDTGSTTNITSGANLYVNATIGLTTSNNQLNVLNAGTLVSASGLFSVGAGGSSNSCLLYTSDAADE